MLRFPEGRQRDHVDVEADADAEAAASAATFPPMSKEEVRLPDGRLLIHYRFGFHAAPGPGVEAREEEG